jgi:hypothetical protein
VKQEEQMPTLRIQHAVSGFDGWKQAFDNDPIGRKDGGVRRYQVLRSVSDPNFVMIDLEFDDSGTAESFLRKLNALWDGPARGVMHDPQAWIMESVETKEL